MPRRSSFRRKRNAPWVRRRISKRRRRVTRIPRPLIVPKSKLVLLKYTDAQIFNPASLNAVGQTWRANSVFDPNLTGVGGQPPGFDQWAAFYSRYVVLGATIRCEVIPSADGNLASNINMMVLQSKKVAGFIPYSEMIQAKSHPNTTVKIISSHPAAGPNNGTIVLRQAFNSKRDFGHRWQSDNEAPTSTNPTEGWHFNLTIGNPFSNTDPGSVTVLTTITYVVKFNDRRSDIYDT